MAKNGGDEDEPVNCLCFCESTDFTYTWNLNDQASTNVLLIGLPRIDWVAQVFFISSSPVNRWHFQRCVLLRGKQNCSEIQELDDSRSNSMPLLAVTT